MNLKVTCICPTRGRFNVLREAVSFFLLQDYTNKELIIFNNHPEPIVPHPKLIKHNVRVINAGDYTGKSMETVYAHALKYVSSDTEYVAVWDDDDMYLPWHLSDNISKLSASNKKAIRASYGYWQDISNSTKDEFTVIRNTLEASMIAKKGYIFFNEDDKDKKHPEFTHPHTSWVVKTTQEDGYLYNNRITGIFRWNYGKRYHHLQSVGPHLNNEETGKNQLLKPIEVSHLFYNFLQKVYLTTEEKNGIVCLTTESKAELYKSILKANVDKFDHIDKYKVWLYWDKPDIPTFIQLCQTSIKENTFAEVVVLNDDTLKSYNLPSYIQSLAPVQRSDYIRVHFLHYYGGWWFDSDTYIVGDLDEYYFKYLINHETVFPWEGNVPGNMTTPVFSSKPYSIIIQQALKNINDYFKTNPDIGWSGIGVNGIMKAVDMLKHRGEGYFFGLPDIAVFGYNNHLLPYWNFNNITTKKLHMIIFHWSQVGAELSYKIKSNETVSQKDISDVYPNLTPLFELRYCSY